MLDAARFDFSKETDIKSLLWEKMSAVVTKQKTAAREEVSFDSLNDSKKPKTAAKKNDGITPPAPVRENPEKGKSK